MELTRKRKWIILGIVLILSLSTFPVFAQACCPAPVADAQVITQISVSLAPDFTVPTLDGGTFTLSEQRGKPVVMFVTASWCTTCFKEAEALAKLYDAYRGRLDILALDVDPSSTPEELARFKEEVGNPGYVWAFDKGGKVSRSYKIMALGTTIIFNQAGEIVYTDIRSTSYKTLEKQVKLILE